MRAVSIVEHSRFARLHAAVAVTRRDAIYLRDSAEAFLANPELTLHEYYHVLCQWNTGELSVARYLAEWVRQGMSYHRIAYEAQARAFAANNLSRYCTLLGAGYDAARDQEPGTSSGLDEASAGETLLTGGDR